MREIDTLVIHCSATSPEVDIGADEIRRWHTDPKPTGNGWSDIGYHYVIRRDGAVENGRNIARPGAHARGHNVRSIGVCLVGGVDVNGDADANYTRRQWAALEKLVAGLETTYGVTTVTGHRELSPDIDGDGTIDANERLKACPCFDVARWWYG